MVEVNIQYYKLDSEHMSIQLKTHQNYPYFSYSDIHSRWVLADEIHNFLIENNISYNLNYKENDDGDCSTSVGWFIVFEKPSDAVFYKLYWHRS